MTKSVTELPEGYEPYLSVDLQKNKKLALFINGLALVIAFVMVIIMNSVIPISTLYDMSLGMGGYFLRFGVLLVGMYAYIILHEAVHGVAMKLCGTKKVKYGFTGLYAFAGSDDYYSKIPYIFIALAPVVFWGIVLLIINVFVPDSWFWVVYIIQIMNISGAAGDIYVTVYFSLLPKDILVKDAGTSMAVYSKG